MSSSKPHKSHSSSVHDSDSESSIEYVQKQSPMSPNIPLTALIASSMKVSALNIDVGNATSQTSSTWSIPTISITLIPPNLTNTQMHVSEGPGITPEVSSRKIHNPNFHVTSSLIQVGIRWHPVNALAKVNSQPSRFHQDLRFMWAMKSGLMVGRKKRPLENITQSGLSEGNPGLTLHPSESFSVWSITFFHNLICLFHWLYMEPEGKTF
ncbi:hypothetical protein O181_097223 [Austropuccinia psidii MF-1]|uniref:Uncharacterized protein n=1 Tax=Austropuccinia psidii MF-1 TaxID=1389203 RepID=A0A9Q3PCY9_9BASI|nr:hypothetical protein [Austropuccinia psidii MF-1]